MALQRLKLGSVTSVVTSECIDQWSTGSGPPPRNFPDILPLMAQWINTGNYEDNRALVEASWAATPASVNERLADH